MPTYEYRCAECAHQFETHQRIDEEPLTVCDRCGGRLRKVFHPAGIVFKGSGFYATDSRSKRTGSKEGTETKKSDSKSDSSSSDASSGSKADSTGDGGSKKETVSSGKSDTKKPTSSGSSS